jgi:shikimate dehydrogenase
MSEPRALTVEAALAGATTIAIVNRDANRGSELVAQLQRAHAGPGGPRRVVVWDHTYRVPDASDVVVNATSIGLFPDVDGRLDLDPPTLRPGMVVADVIPNPPRSPLIRDAEARGCAALDGLGMLVNQGVISIRRWTGIDADPAVMRRKLEELFEA